MFKKFFLLLTFQFISISLLTYNQSDIDDLNSGETNLQSKDFSSADLSYKHYKNRNFTGSDFTNTNAQNSKFENCTFDNVNFTNAQLNQTTFTGCSFDTANLTDTIFVLTTNSNCDFTKTMFTDTNMLDSSYSNCTFSQTILLRPYITDLQRESLVQQGCLNPAGSIMVCSDLHLRHKGSSNLSTKMDQVTTMSTIALERGFKNNVLEIIYAGDLVNNYSPDFTVAGDEENEWGYFNTMFINTFKEAPFVSPNTIRTNTLIGNHDRKGGVLSYDSYASKKIKALNQSLIDSTGEYGQDYYKVSNSTLNLDIYMLGECPTKFNYKPVNWFTSNIDTDKTSILVSHYSPIKNLNWWTNGNEPRQLENHVNQWDSGTAYDSDVTNGNSVVNTFASMISSYEDNILIYIGGHYHDTFLQKWGNIWTLNCADNTKFALIHLTSGGELVAIELYSFTDADDVTRYYPKDLT
ncbi:hypothetical protein GF385_03795 [Candidatus Dependentiae bacterium]|nr:hypothetical protein [Candidatus Dependentiae bacterium]